MKQTTRRGVFINIDDSNITFKHHGKTYKFSSNKKRDIFISRCQARINHVNGNFMDIVKSKCYGINVDLDQLPIVQAKLMIIDCIYDTVYDNMLYK